MRSKFKGHSSSAVYLVEHQLEGSQFTSIPSSIWWSCITITTVGYGDLIPDTVIGKSNDS